jgi:hypothetical protein
MAITYTWDIVQLETYPSLDGKVDSLCTVHWKLAGIDGSAMCELAGATGLNQTSTEDNFVPYSSLTKAMVLEWAKDTIGEDAVKQYEDAIANEIERRVAPKVVPRDVPWA